MRVTPTASLVHVTPDAEFLLEEAIRVCYNSFDKCDGTIECARKLIKKVIGMWHLDTIEHGTATFYVTCSRATMAQFTRHRIASFGVQSQRYVKYDCPTFVMVDKYEEGKEEYELFMDEAYNTYQLLLDKGWKKEDARMVLPEAWGTEFYVTMNLRSLRHFLELRCDRAAQHEIRSLARSMLEQIHREVPSVFDDLHEKFLGGNNGV